MSSIIILLLHSYINKCVVSTHLCKFIIIFLINFWKNIKKFFFFHVLFPDILLSGIINKTLNQTPLKKNKKKIMGIIKYWNFWGKGTLRFARFCRFVNVRLIVKYWKKLVKSGEQMEQLVIAWSICLGILFSHNIKTNPLHPPPSHLSKASIFLDLVTPSIHGFPLHVSSSLAGQILDGFSDVGRPWSEETRTWVLTIMRIRWCDQVHRFGQRNLFGIVGLVKPIMKWMCSEEATFCKGLEESLVFCWFNLLSLCSSLWVMFLVWNIYCGLMILLPNFLIIIYINEQQHC